MHIAVGKQYHKIWIGSNGTEFNVLKWRMYTHLRPINRNLFFLLFLCMQLLKNYLSTVKNHAIVNQCIDHCILKTTITCKHLKFCHKIEAAVNHLLPSLSERVDISRVYISSVLFLLISYLCISNLFWGHLHSHYTPAHFSFTRSLITFLKWMVWLRPGHELSTTAYVLRIDRFFIMFITTTTTNITIIAAFVSNSFHIIVYLIFLHTCYRA